MLIHFIFWQINLLKFWFVFQISPLFFFYIIILNKVTWPHGHLHAYNYHIWVSWWWSNIPVSELHIRSWSVCMESFTGLTQFPWCQVRSEGVCKYVYMVLRDGMVSHPFLSYTRRSRDKLRIHVALSMAYRLIYCISTSIFICMYFFPLQSTSQLV